MSLRRNFLSLLVLLMLLSACSKGYYAHIPRGKRQVAKVEKEPTKKPLVQTVKTVDEQKEIMQQTVVEVTPKKKTQVQPNTTTSNSADMSIAKKPQADIVAKAITPLKTKVDKQDKPKRYGYPDSSLWFFYVGVFLMVLGLIFIITPALGFGVGLPFIITGAIIMIMGLFIN